MTMRIALVISSMQAGGAERVASNLVAAWSARGWIVHLITVSSAREDFYGVPDTVIRHSLDLSDNSPNPLKGVSANVRRAFAVWRCLRSIEPDVVVAFMTSSAILTIFAARLLRCRVVVAEHTYPPQQPLGRLWETLRRLTYPYADRVVMLTTEGLQWLSVAVPRARGSVIPNPIIYPLERGSPAVLPASILARSQRMLLAVGRLDDGKQLHLLIEAFSRVSAQYEGWLLAILGDGPNRAALEEQVTRLHLSDRIKLIGRVGNVGEWYQAAHLYALTSRYEGFPSTLCEALAYGCPSISYDCDTGPRDIIRHGVDGLLVRPVGDVQSLADALSAVMSDDAVRLSMASRAPEVRERYSIERIIALWDSVLGQIP